MGLLGSVPEPPAEEGTAFLVLLVPLSSSPPYLLYQAGMPLREDPVLPALHSSVQLYTGRYVCKVNVSTTQYVGSCTWRPGCQATAPPAARPSSLPSVVTTFIDQI